MPLIPALRRQRQTDLCESSLVYKASFRTARAKKRNPVSKNEKTDSKSKTNKTGNML